MAKARRPVLIDRDHMLMFSQLWPTFGKILEDEDVVFVRLSAEGYDFFSRPFEMN